MLKTGEASAKMADFPLLPPLHLLARIDVNQYHRMLENGIIKETWRYSWVRANGSPSA